MTVRSVGTINFQALKCVIDRTAMTLQQAKDQRTVLQKVLDFILSGRYCSNDIEHLWTQLKGESSNTSLTEVLYRLYGQCETLEDKKTFRDNVHIDLQGGQYRLYFRLDDKGISVPIEKGDIPLFFSETVGGKYVMPVLNISYDTPFVAIEEQLKTSEGLCDALLDSDKANMPVLLAHYIKNKNLAAVAFLKHRLMGSLASLQSDDNRAFYESLVQAYKQLDNNGTWGNGTWSDVRHYVEDSEFSTFLQALRDMKSPLLFQFALEAPKDSMEPAFTIDDIRLYETLAQQASDPTKKAYYYRCAGEIAYTFGHKDQTLLSFQAAVKLDETHQARLNELNAFYDRCLCFDDSLGAIWQEAVQLLLASDKPLWSDSIENKLPRCGERSKELTENYNALDEDQKTVFNTLRDLLGFARAWPEFSSQILHLQAVIKSPYGIDNTLHLVSITDENVNNIIARGPMGNDWQLDPALKEKLSQIPELPVSDVPELEATSQIPFSQFSFLHAASEGKNRDQESDEILRGKVLAWAVEQGLVPDETARKARTAAAADFFMSYSW